jgi:hypothetical protein
MSKSLNKFLKFFCPGVIEKFILFSKINNNKHEKYYNLYYYNYIIDNIDN